MDYDASRQDEDDQDLLTYNESGVRLTEEIEVVKAAIVDTPDGEREPLEARLRALTVALERNSKLAAINTGESAFLDYEPPTL